MKFNDFIDLFKHPNQSEIEVFVQNEDLTEEEKLLILAFSTTLVGQYRESMDYSKKLLLSVDQKYQYIGKILLVRGLIVTHEISEIDNLLNEASTIIEANKFEIDDYVSFFKGYWYNYEAARLYLKLRDNQGALSYFEKFLGVMLKYQFQRGIVSAANNLIQIYYDIGEFEKGLEYLEQMRLYVENHPDDAFQQCYYLNQKVVSILLIEGVREDLPDQFDKWEEFTEKFSNYEITGFLMVKSYYFYILGDNEGLLKLVNRFKEIATVENNEAYHSYGNLINAFYLMMSPRTKHQGKAQELLENIVYSDQIESTLTLWSMHFLLISLFTELTNSGDLKILEEIEFLIEKLGEYAKESRNLFPSILVEIMNAKISIIRGDFDSYLGYIEKAELLLIGVEAIFFKNLILDAKFSIEKDIENIKHMINDGVSIKEQLQKLNYSRYLDDVLKYVLVS